jgi:hypothetical protein
VFSDLNAHIDRARAQVATSMATEKIVHSVISFDLLGILPKVKELFSKFFDNPLSLNLALIEFFENLFIVFGGAFGQDSEMGLYQMLEDVCTTAKRRIGMKEGTIENIKKAYRELGGDDTIENDSVFVQIVVLLEFLKNLNSISQSRSLLISREAAVIE